MRRIDSPENPLIKKIVSLKVKKYREIENLFILEGLRIVEDVISEDRNKDFIAYLILSEGNEDLLSRKPFSFFEDRTLIIKDRLVKEISDTVVSQGVFAVMKKNKPDLKEEIKKYSRVLLLDNISDPGNMGTIVRTALAAKIDAVISFKGTVDYYNPKTIRSTMGAINKLSLFDGQDYDDIYSLLKENGFFIFSADLQGNRNIYSAFPEEKIALVMGSEAKGILFPDDYIDESIYIPMDKESESLNVAVAAGIILYSINKSKFEIF